MKRLLVLFSVVSLFLALPAPHTASPSPFPSGVTPGQFASRPFTPPRVQARVRQIPIRPGLANVSNLQQMTRLFRLTTEQRQLLAKNGFVVTPGAEEQLFYVYENNDYLVIPSFVSTDTVLQVYHVFYDFTLRKVEQTKLVPELTAMARGLVELSERDHREAASPFVREAAKRNLAFATVTHRLMDPAAPIPSEVADLVGAELKLIEAHAGRSESPVFAGSGINVDYSQFVPRGHYTRTEELKRFFGAMMWLGLMPFPLENAATKDADRMSTAQALLLTAALFEKRADATPLIAAWDRIYAPTAFYVGTADDLTPVEYQELASRVLGSSGVSARSLTEDAVDRFTAEARKSFRGPGIAASIGDVLGGAVQERQFRLMGQRFIIDSRVMQELTYPKVGGDDNRRLMASGLDVMAAFGSKRATALQLSNPAMSGYPRYESQLAKMTAEIAAVEQETWTSNLYWSWLWTLRSLLEPAGEGYPSFMRTQAWTDKSLSTALGSWAELKHDTVLYGKQSGAECGGGDEPPIVRGYVEPNVECYARLQHLTTMSRQGLRERTLIDEGDAVDSAFQEFEDLLGFLRRVSEKQLRNEALTRQEYDQIRYIGGQIERLTLSVIDENLTGWFEIESETDKNMAVIADVHTGGNSALQVGVGHADTIWVVAPIEGRLVLCRGAVFSYYEFAHPINDRLTDEKWQGMLKHRPAPARPPWVRGFMSTALQEPSSRRRSRCTARGVDLVTRLLLSVRRRNRTRIGFCGRIVAVVVIAASFSGLGSAAGEAGPDDAGVVIAIVGDVLLDRGVKAALERRTFDELLSDVAPVLRDADLAVGNLECALSKRGLRSAKPFSFRGDPAHAAALARAGFDAMSLANNHSLDYGRVALSDTITALEGAAIAAIGAGPSRAAAMQARVIERKGVRIALLGYCAMYVEATTPRADAVTISESDLEVFLQEIRAAKSVSDVVIVLPHWGREWSPLPNETQERLAAVFIEAGATIVAGAHPHVLQPIERRGTSLVAWSLGNFVFDQRGEGADSCVLRVTVGRGGVRGYDVVPVVIRESAPMRVDGVDAERIAARLRKRAR